MREIWLFVLIGIGLPATAQLGGEHTYDFLNLTHSARVATLGGQQVALWDDDISLAYHNPSLLHQTHDQHLNLSFVNYFSDIFYGYALWGKQLDSIGTIALGIHYMDYGDFIRANQSGVVEGEFKSSEYAFNVLFSRQIKNVFSIGINLKPILSNLERYTSFGLAADLGLSYHSPDSLFTAGISLRNLGSQITSYYGEEGEPLPTELQAGLSYKLRYAPFRFFYTYRHLEQYDLTDGETITAFPSRMEEIGDQLMRHSVIGVELTPLESLVVGVGYNYQRRKELQIEERVSTVGFSFGIGLQLKRIRIHYARATYHLSGASNHFTFSTNLEEMFGSVYRP